MWHKGSPHSRGPCLSWANECHDASHSTPQAERNHTITIDKSGLGITVTSFTNWKRVDRNVDSELHRWGILCELQYSPQRLFETLFSPINISRRVSRGSKLVLEARPEDGRGRRRPRLEWEEYVEGLARKRGRKLPEVKQLAQDRK